MLDTIHPVQVIGTVILGLLAWLVIAAVNASRG
jgi:hypothetical protein